jgi:DNA-binding protein HU-beta
MNKAELIEQVAVGAHLTKADAGRAMDIAIESIKGTLKKGEDVRIHGLGTFKVKERAARKGRNPKTGEEVDIPASRKVSFSAAKELKEAL